MQQQMLFVRPSPGSSPAGWAGSDGSSPRRVKFAVQSAPPSPVVYRRGQRSQVEESPYAEDLVEETRVQQRRQQPRRQQKAQRSPVAARPTAAVRTRRPGWDADVNHGSTLFDASLKRLQLFQPRAGDRKKEEENGKASVIPKRGTRATASKRNKPATTHRDHEHRIGVSQILQGLRLLGLPATHNQISDYVYLIHEGQYNTIDLEEWEILVGTLDAASRPSSHSPRNAYTSAMPSHSPSSSRMSGSSPYNPLPSSNSPYQTGDQLDSPTPKRRDHVPAAPRSAIRTNHASYEEKEHYTTSVQREAIVSAEHQPIPDDDPYLVEIQNRIEGMFERAQATAALRWSPELGNNQAENDPDDSKSDRILKRAATVVYSLRASLFPLVHQAEATLREIQQRHGSKLSLFLPPGDMATIAQNSDMLASAILDDILLDTVQLLNDEDRQQSCRQLEASHAGQLDDIMARIQEIEQAENSIIQQGLALNCETQGVKCDLPTASFQDRPTQVTPNADPLENSNLPNLTLPLEVVMNINVPDSPLMYQEPRDAGAVGSTALDGYEFVSDRSNSPLRQTSFTKHPVRTSILQGKRLQSIERKQHKFLQHRRLVESSLAETGMAQFAVIEILEEMLLDDLVEQTAAELNDTVLSMSDMLMTSLL
ncbi:hypothetical protein KRP22_005882 [Phytophthora ramorum]|nr:hypothetical protein KRP22_2987 [Phytophthora ramorum]